MGSPGVMNVYRLVFRIAPESALLFVGRESLVASVGGVLRVVHDGVVVAVCRYEVRGSAGLAGLCPPGAVPALGPDKLVAQSYAVTELVEQDCLLVTAVECSTIGEQVVEIIKENEFFFTVAGEERGSYNTCEVLFFGGGCVADHEKRSLACAGKVDELDAADGFPLSERPGNIRANRRGNSAVYFIYMYSKTLLYGKRHYTGVGRA